MSESEFSNESYTVGWICALDIELAASRAMLDVVHPCQLQDENDSNNYTLGSIGQHNVVLACLPSGTTGTNPAAVAAANMLRSFPKIRFGLMVGVGGGAPAEPSEDPYEDIRLGDVVVSNPTGTYGGVIQYDFGKTVQEGQFVQTGSLNKPPVVLRSGVSNLRALHLSEGTKISQYVSEMLESKPTMKRKFQSPGSENDQLFEADYDHSGGLTCAKCDKERIAIRESREADEPVVHYGIIGSANQVMRHAATRERLRQEKNIICFEMEAAGLMDTFPCLVIRGICDYSDTHKNKRWQPYAAATAAAYAKELLGIIPATQVASTTEAAKITGIVREEFKVVHKKLDSLQQGINTALTGIDKTKHDDCMRDLMVTDPRLDKKRIEDNKDTLLKDSYAWILEDPAFLSWRDDNETQLLWIEGGPGKGKTMMMVGLVEELSKRLGENPEFGILSYFFCQGTDNRLNNSVSILRGLIYLLAVQQPGLVSHLRKEYDHMGKQLFEGDNAIYALRGVLLAMLTDTNLTKIYLMVDALDECDSSLSQLLEVIVPPGSNILSKAKWLVASRYSPDIDERLQPNDLCQKISLELNSANISRAVNTFIDKKVSELTERKTYDDALQKEVRTYLYKNSEGTFLWAALVVKRLQEIPLWKMKTQLADVLGKFPKGLKPLYERMMEQIRKGEDAELCTSILSSVTLAYRPLHLKELVTTAELPEQLFDDVQSLRDLVDLCGSFLTIRGEVVYLVHQSAKDYFSDQNGLKIFPLGKEEGHNSIAYRSLDAMSCVLKRNICGLQNPAVLSSEIAEDIRNDRLTHIKYSCCYWTDHLRPDYVGLSEGGKIQAFLETHFLYWLEALSLLGELGKSVQMVTDLENMLASKPGLNPSLLSMIRDGTRFLLTNISIIEESPLQIYCSSLLFAPEKSIIRTQFKSQIPDWFRELPEVESNWSSVLQTLEGHQGSVDGITLFPNGSKLASASASGRGGDVRVWDVRTGKCEQVFNNQKGFSSVTISPDGSKLAAKLYEGTVLVWSTSSWKLETRLYNNYYSDCTLSFSPDSSKLVSPSSNYSILIWDTNSWSLERTLEGHSDTVACVTFSPDSSVLVSGSGSGSRKHDNTIRIWDTNTWEVLRVLQGHSSLISSVSFSPNGEKLVSTSYETLHVWDTVTWEAENILKAHDGCVHQAVYSPDGRKLASVGDDQVVVILDAGTLEIEQVLEGHLGPTSSVVFVGNTKVASASYDGTIRLWDITAGGTSMPVNTGPICENMAFSPDGRKLIMAASEYLPSLKRGDVIQVWDVNLGVPEWPLYRHSQAVGGIAFSYNNDDLASGLLDDTIVIWDLSSGKIKNRLTGHTDSVRSVIFSHDGQKLASSSYDNTIRIWNVKTAKVEHVLTGHSGGLFHVAFSPDDTKLASTSYDSTIRVWNVCTGNCEQKLEGFSAPNYPRPFASYDYELAFSPDGSKLAAAAGDCNVFVWDTNTWEVEQTLTGFSDTVCSVSFSANGSALAASSYKDSLKIWDVDTWELKKTFDAYIFPASNVAFSCDGAITDPFYGVDQSRRWITQNRAKIIHLPWHYRPIDYTSKGSTLAIGPKKGGCVFIKFRSDIKPGVV